MVTMDTVRIKVRRIHSRIYSWLTLAEYVALPVSDLISIPKTTASATELAPLLCAGGTALGAVRSANLNPGEWLCVAGAAGGVGGLAVKYSKHFGYRVVAIDSSHKESYCKNLGSDAFVGYEESTTVVQRVTEATGGGVHGTVVCNASPASYSLVSSTASRFVPQISKPTET
jgi:propanol-preferring alcohol dehydrogenase